MSSITVGSRSTMIKLPASPRDSPSVRSPSGVRSPRQQKMKNMRRIQHPANKRGGGLHVNRFNFNIPEDAELIVVSDHNGDSTKGAVVAKKNSTSNHNNILQIAEEVATETAAHATNVVMNTCAVELPSDGMRPAIKPKLTPTPTKTTSEQPISSDKNSEVPRVRSKKVLVIDTGSGKKCHLTRDDHSLTDKELHVYHQQKRSRQKQQRQRARRFESEDDSEVDEEKTTATFQTTATGHTMVSALTEVSYAKNKREMLPPLSPRSPFGKKAAADEHRDDEEAVEVGHYQQSLMDIRDPAPMSADGGDEKFLDDHDDEIWSKALAKYNKEEREKLVDQFETLYINNPR